MPDTPRPPAVLAAARAVAGELAVPPDWPATGRARCPRWTAVLRRAGWPVATVDVLIPQRTSAGNPAPDVVRPVAVVPVGWLRRLAGSLGVRFADLCAGIVGDE